MLPQLDSDALVVWPSVVDDLVLRPEYFLLPLVVCSVYSRDVIQAVHALQVVLNLQFSYKSG